MIKLYDYFTVMAYIGCKLRNDYGKPADCLHLTQFKHLVRLVFNTLFSYSEARGHCLLNATESE